MSIGRLRLAIASESEREAIYRLRHEVYARELGQHPENSACRLTDALDAFNVYIAASVQGEIVGFISVTPPGNGSYSIDKYLSREQLPFDVDGELFEVRLLTVIDACRGGYLAGLLMYAALRWVETHGGQRIVAIGRREVLDIYLKVGLQPLGQQIQAGSVTFELLTATTQALRSGLSRYHRRLERIRSSVDWDLGIPFHRPSSCFHGGAFFAAIGEEFQNLKRHGQVISADVLDAWYPPSPTVVSGVREHLEWLLSTSPPTGCEGLIRTIAEVRGIDTDCVLPGAGSSNLIYLAFRAWLSASSRVVLIDPSYGEYAHIVERVIQCRVERVVCSPKDHYRLDLSALGSRLHPPPDLLVLINPNNPTGRHVPRQEMEDFLEVVPATTRIWIDETYVEYAGSEESLESFAVGRDNIVICKSMSKVYALSGARVAYLCASPRLLEELRPITPPWSVSLVAQVAAVEALKDPDYYARRHEETRVLRTQLAKGLAALGFAVSPSAANFLLCRLPAHGSTASSLINRCREHDLFLRDVSSLGSRIDRRTVRVAVKDDATNRRIIEILRKVLGENEGLQRLREAR